MHQNEYLWSKGLRVNKQKQLMHEDAVSPLLLEYGLILILSLAFFHLCRGMDSGIFGWQTKPEPETKNYYGKLVITSGEIQAMAISQGTTLTAFSIKDVDRFPHEVST